MRPLAKLGTDRNFTGLLPAVFALLALAAAHLLFGREVAWRLVPAVFFVCACFAWIAFARTRSKAYLASGLFLSASTLAFAAKAGLLPISSDRTPALGLLTLASFVWLVFLLATRQAKWRGRDILEFAARPVESISDGFTARPKPAGRVEFSRDELLGFAEFARRHLIAMPHVEADRIVFVLVSMGTEFRYLFSIGRDHSQDTWVGFANSGDVSVHISKDDYLAYRDELTFDRLCESLATVFTDFVRLYRDRSQIRIINRLDAMRVGLFS